MKERTDEGELKVTEVDGSHEGLWVGSNRWRERKDV